MIGSHTTKSYSSLKHRGGGTLEAWVGEIGREGKVNGNAEPGDLAPENALDIE